MALKNTRAGNYPEWYQNVVSEADMAENSSSPGCMVIKPWGYGIWERIRDVFDEKIKSTDHENCYFPMFIPLSFFQKEAEHVDGFAKEMAVVTHSRLSMKDGKLVPDSELDEPLIVRPTSEAIIADSFSKWVKSYRDLPVLVNQWANVVRWEMRPRLFLRTREFLWQEGHTAHATAKEAEEETTRMLEAYRELCEDTLAMPVICGRKPEHEKFPGAVDTYCVEAMMQDGKALQAGTSHFLGQNFAKAFDVQFTNAEGKLEYVWATSWGVSTRLMGALIMAHSDDNGLVLPPKLAPLQVVIVPIYKGAEGLKKISDKVQGLIEKLRAKGISVKYDDRDTQKPGWKFADYELKGVPVRLAMGERDLENGTIEVARRDTLTKETLPLEGIVGHIEKLLEDIQENIYKKALDFRNSMITKVDSYDEFKNLLESKGGFFLCHWDGTAETEEKIKADTKATIRCIPFDSPEEEGKDMVTGKPSHRRVLIAKAY